MTDTGALGWRQVMGAAEDGSLVLDEGVGARCAQHCDVLITKLKALVLEATYLGEVKGLGTLPSGIALAKKFSQAAVGGGGTYSMVQALKDHITEVQAMKDVFLRIEAQYAATDQATADTLGVIDPGA